MTSDATNLSKQEISKAQEAGVKVITELNKVILGQEKLVREVVTAALAGGHVLLEGLPGLGKTELVKGLAKTLEMQFQRVQFTPDLLPGDITGGSVLQEEDGIRKFLFQKGPVFTNVLLADEINRASPKTQAALLEAMAEKKVTILGDTHDLPDPFFVLATQNPLELEGTYPLPEAQLDRFMFKVEVGQVETRVLEAILNTRHHGTPPTPQSVATRETLGNLAKVSRKLHLPEPVVNWTARLCAASHPKETNSPEEIKNYVRYGVSPRAAISIIEAARIDALLDGKNYVGFDNIRKVVEPALTHRLGLNHHARLDNVNAKMIVERLLSSIDELGESLPTEVIDMKS